MEREPITSKQVLELLGDIRAGRCKLQCPLLYRDLVTQECHNRHLSESPESHWQALTDLVGDIVLQEAARCLGIPPQQLKTLAEQAGEPLFDLLRKAYQEYAQAPLCLAWLYLYVHYIAPCKLQHVELERRVRGTGMSKDSNHFWNQLKNKVAGPALARRLNEREAATQVSIGRRPPSSLPAPEPGFVGRRRARDTTAKALIDSPMVTLTGPGGIGKSSLALKLAWSESSPMPKFPDGRHWLDLNRVADASLLPALFWQEFGHGRPLPADPMSALRSQLRDRRILLVLDNCEHLLPVVAKTCAQLLRACPALRILATSRQPLKLDDERVLRLRGLAVPPEGEREDLMDFDAVRAFVQEAQRHEVSFALTSHNAALVTAIVRRVDGLPLAIKLIAPWVRQLSLAEILERLDALLARGADHDRALPERHRTLQACLRWSLDSLVTLDREVFLQLAVFQGGFSLDAVAAICHPASGPLDDAPAFDLMSRLIDLSLVEVDTSAAQTRGRLLEPIRHLCLQGLEAQAGVETLRERHAAHFLALAERLEAEGEAQGDHAWLDQIDTELANLHAAQAWAETNGRLETSLRLATALWRHHQRRGLGEATLAALERGLAAQDADVLPLLIRARAHNAAGSLALLLAKDEAALQQLRAAEDLLMAEAPSRLRVVVLTNLGSALMGRGMLDGATRYLEAARALACPEDGPIQAKLQRSLASLQLWRGDPRAALSCLDRSESFWLRRGDSYELALCLLARGTAQARLGRGPLARRALADAAARFEAAGDVTRACEALRFLADVCLQDLATDEADQALKQALALESETQDPVHGAMIRLLGARLSLLQGRAVEAEEALRHLRATLDPNLGAAVYSLVDMEHAWTLLALDLKDEALPLARRAVSGYLPAEDLDYLPELLECLAVVSGPEKGGGWLNALLQIRRAAGLPRSQLQTQRCGPLSVDSPEAEAGPRGDGSWRTWLTTLAAEMLAAGSA